MNSITLRKGGFYAREYDEKESKTTFSKVDGPICLHFQSTIEVDRDVTVEDLMRVLMKNESDIDMMFYGFSKGLRIRPFYEEMLLPPNNKRIDIAYVEVGWSSDYFGSDRPGKSNELFLFVQISGIAKKRQKNELRSYNLSQVPLNDWKHIGLSVCDMMRVHDFRVNQKGETGKTETQVITLIEAKRDMTLYDFIGGFIESIAWYGYPSQRKERMDDIEEIISEPDEDIGEYSLEDKEYELKKALGEEDYERASVLKKEIDEMRKFLGKD